MLRTGTPTTHAIIFPKHTSLEGHPQRRREEEGQRHTTPTNIANLGAYFQDSLPAFLCEILPHPNKQTEQIAYSPERLPDHHGYLEGAAHVLLTIKTSEGGE